MSINENEMLIKTYRLKNILMELQFGINDLNCCFEEAKLFQLNLKMEQMNEGTRMMMNMVDMIETCIKKCPPDETNNNVPFIG